MRNGSAYNCGYAVSISEISPFLELRFAQPVELRGVRGTIHLSITFARKSPRVLYHAVYPSEMSH